MWARQGVVEQESGNRSLGRGLVGHTGVPARETPVSAANRRLRHPEERQQQLEERRSSSGRNATLVWETLVPQTTRGLLDQAMDLLFPTGMMLVDASSG